MPAYETSFEIEAKADRVWEALADLDRYAEWNPQIPYANGTLKTGSTIRLRLALPGKAPMDLSATIEELRPPALLTWRGHAVAPWFFEGYRRFEIVPLGEHKVRVTHLEAVRGLVAPLFGLLMGAAVRTSQTALNEALRSRAESER
jgi:hypothetical protein